MGPLIIMSLLARRIKPMMDRVLIKKFQAPKKTTGGLYLPESAQKDEIPQGIVTAVGPGMFNQEGVRIPMTLKEGDEVLLLNYKIQNKLKHYHINFCLN